MAEEYVLPPAVTHLPMFMRACSSTCADHRPAGVARRAIVGRAVGAAAQVPHGVALQRRTAAAANGGTVAAGPAWGPARRR